MPSFRPAALRQSIAAAALTLAGVHAASAQFGEAHMPQPQGPTGPSLSVRLLPEGPGGIASEAVAAAMLDRGEHLVVAGNLLAGANGGVWRGAYWTLNAETVSGPQTLPDLGYGALVADFTSTTLPHMDGFFGGSVIDSEGITRPAAWAGIGAEANLTVLPTPGESGGEVLGVATGDVNGDGVADVIACGVFTDPNTGTQPAALWFCDWVDYVMLPLPPLVPGGAAQAFEMSSCGDCDLYVLGHADNQSGNRVAVGWRITAGVATIEPLVDLPAGYESAARTETVDNNETITIGGIIRTPAGADRPALLTDTDADWRITMLPTGPYANGRVNSIIAILIGLVAAGDVSGPNGARAAIWINQNEIPTFIDLNRIAVGLPPRMQLTTAAFLLPYIEQENLYRVGGAATGLNGRRHAFIATMHPFNVPFTVPQP